MQGNRPKSLKINMLLNAIKGLMSIVFPLITFPYVSSVLGVDNLGRYSFANSIISYLVLISGLGISTYAIREGAKLRENKREIESFSSEMLSINVWSTALSYLLFFVLLIAVPKFYDYRVLLIILSLQIVFKTIGIEWLYSIYEDYAYITIRSIIFQVISLILLFVFVKTERDINIYAIISVLSGVGSNVLNYIHSRKYCKVRLKKAVKWKIHLKPILILFAMSATVTVYVSSDITILGFLSGDYIVGIYSVSTKIYTIVKTILSSILIVSIPRLSSIIGHEDHELFNTVSDDIYKTLITVVAPAIAGIIVLRKEIVLLISSTEYISATSSLSLLSIALFFCMGAWFWGQCILVPCKMETTVFKITIISALTNIALNFLLIPIWNENAAALTTIIAEGISFIWCGFVGHKKAHITNLGRHYAKVLCGCAIIILVGYFVHLLNLSILINIIIIIPVSIITYSGIEIILKNESIKTVISSIRMKVMNRKQ